jgi:hypothetical protein
MLESLAYRLGTDKDEDETEREDVEAEAEVEVTTERRSQARENKKVV